MWITLLIAVLTFAPSFARTKTCSTLETVRVHLDEPEQQEVVTQRLINNVTKKKYEPLKKVYVIEAAWISTYCPPVEFGMVKDCVQKEGRRKLDKDALNLYENKAKVLVPRPCKDGACDGTDMETCLEPSSYIGVEVPHYTRLSLSSSWIHNRCSREIRVTIKEVTAQVTLTTGFGVWLEIQDVGGCEIEEPSRVCAIEDYLIMKVKDVVKITTTTSSLPCLSDKTNLVCYDKDEQLQVLMDPFKCNSLPGLTYCRDDANIVNKEKYSNFQATLEDWNEVSNQLIFETMELSFQATLLQSKIRQLKEIVFSMLLFQYGVTEDPLEKAAGFSLGSPILENGTIVAYVCHPGTRRQPKPLLGTNNTKDIHLLPNMDKIGRYEEFRSKFIFLSTPPVYLGNSSAFSKVLHGDSALVDISSLLDFLPLHIISKLWNNIIATLTVLNTFMIFFVLKRK